MDPRMDPRKKRLMFLASEIRSTPNCDPDSHGRLECWDRARLISRRVVRGFAE